MQAPRCDGAIFFSFQSRYCAADRSKKRSRRRNRVAAGEGGGRGAGGGGVLGKDHNDCKELPLLGK